MERGAAGLRPAGDDDWMGVDVSAARGVLGWEPVRTPRDMVGDLWRAAAGRE
ncbi:hypothetical protein [Streptomyces sp. MMS20-AI2-20]|uniref:hypothetical protein n=1 Tax=Streptomyces sp. MMS20-AI2-20 TaxID=2925835 RepID=UPI001F6218F1|nr:hypothetical protein [Streptomyces sp. MMS20-AI2-20]MCI4145544.1 hypothetical protein [Streptomyces sp. MMS20-AI2-20]